MRWRRVLSDSFDFVVFDTVKADFATYIPDYIFMSFEEDLQISWWGFDECLHLDVITAE